MRKPLVAHLLSAVRQALGQVAPGETPPEPARARGIANASAVAGAAPSEFGPDTHDATNSFWFSAHLDERPRFDAVDTRRSRTQRPDVTSGAAE